MARLTASTTTTDQTRFVRLQLAWMGGDKPALDYLMDEIMADPGGVPGILFAATDFTTRLGEQVAPDYADQLRTQLLDHEQGNDQ